MTVGQKQGSRLRSLMILGTSSGVGKSVLSTGLCRIFAQDGYAVVPFKSQNMSLNSAVTPSGAEIGRAQAVQAEAAGVAPSEHMNPVLLKPTGDMRSQVIVQGKVYGNLAAREYFRSGKARLWEAVQESYRSLRESSDMVVIEGAGSPVELNLKDRDIANLRVAQMADAAVILVADIDRGGVFASVLGTLLLMEPHERERVRGILINRFRGDPALFEDGAKLLEARAGIPVLGVIPYLSDLRIDEEDSASLSADRYRSGRRFADGRPRVRIGVVRVPHMANFTDIDSLYLEEDVEIIWAESTSALDDVDAVVLPGSKNTIDDLLWLQRVGLDQAVRGACKNGATILGICGGFQMMGASVHDPTGVESSVGEAQGLGLHDGITVMLGEKRTVLVSGQLEGPFRGVPVSGYEIHMGETRGISVSDAFCVLQVGAASKAAVVRSIGPGSPASQPVSLETADEAHQDGFVSPDGRIIGTYLHGILDNDAFRMAWLNGLRRRRDLPEAVSTISARDLRDAEYDRVAAVMRDHMDIPLMYRLLET
ncbi:MAG: cobyric acid synthase [Firmicutes bacterium]|nr:cobyric acid synthase [Bacillota bacterium]